MKQIEPVLQPQRFLRAAREARRLEVGAEPRRDVGRDRDASAPAMRIETKRRIVIARQLAETLPAGEPLGSDPGKVAGRILDPNHGRQPRQLREGLNRNIGDGSGGDVVDDDRQVAAFRQRTEMGRDPGLAGLVVIRDDDQCGVGSELLGHRHLAQGFGGRITAAARNDRDPARRHVDRGSDHGGMLVRTQRRGFAGRSARDQPARALGDLPVDQVAKGGKIDVPCGERSDQRGDRSGKHDFASLCRSLDRSKRKSPAFSG